jgi:hypothetical protein
MRSLVLYGAYNLSQEKVSLNAGNPRTMPTHNLERNSVARRDGTIALSTNFEEKEFEFTGRVKKPAGHTPEFKDILNEFKNVFNVGNRYLRITRNWKLITNADSTSNWNLGGDGANLTTDSHTYMISNAALKFDIDVSTSGNNYVTVTNTSLGNIDLEDEEEQGSIEFWMYIPDNDELTDLDFKIGSDSSNYYYTNDIPTNYEGRVLENGWNYISIDWSDVTGWEGNPDASSIDWVQIQLNYSSNQIDRYGFLINGLVWVDDNDTINYPNVTAIDLEMDEEAGFTTYQPFSISMISTDGIGKSTHSVTIQELTGQTAIINDFNIDFRGTYKPLPRINIDLTSVSDINGITYRNETSNEALTISTTFAADDSISIDTENLSVLRNGSAIDYTGVFPEHVVGNNNIQLSFPNSTFGSINQTDYDTTYISLDDYAVVQSFQAPETGVLNSIEVYMKSVPNNSIKVHIYNESGGEPNNKIFDRFFSSNTVYEWHEFNVNLNVTSGNTYYLYIINGGYNGMKHYVKYQESGDSYANGQIYYEYKYDAPTGYGENLVSLGSGADLAFKLTVQPIVDNIYDVDLNYFKRYI